MLGHARSVDHGSAEPGDRPTTHVLDTSFACIEAALAGTL